MQNSSLQAAVSADARLGAVMATDPWTVTLSSMKVIFST
jgi:hypothetical protein